MITIVRAALLLSSFAALSAPRAGEYAPRALKPFEISSSIHAKNAVQMIQGGIFPYTPQVSLDGKWLTYIEESDDIHESNVVLLKSDGTMKKRVPTPAGFKVGALLLGGAYDDGFASTHPHKLLIELSAGSKSNVYIGNPDSKQPGWVVWKKGPYLDLVTDAEGRFIAMVRADLGEPGPAHYQKRPGDELWVQPVKEGKPVGAAYRVAPAVSGHIRAPAFAGDGKTLYFSVMQERDAPGPHIMLYSVENRANAEAVDLVPAAIDVTVGVFGSLPPGSSGDIIAFTRLLPRPGESIAVPTGHIYSQNRTSGVMDTLVQCDPPIVCGSPAFDPTSRKLYFTAQMETEAGGLFVTEY